MPLPFPFALEMYATSSQALTAQSSFSQLASSQTQSTGDYYHDVNTAAAVADGEGGSSMSSLLLGPLNELQHLSQSLFQSLSLNQRTTLPPSADAFLECDNILAAAVQIARTHQLKQRKIESLKNEILELDAHWRDIIEDLQKGKVELGLMIKEGDERIEAIDKAKEGSLPYPELLQYAQSLSSFTSAPPGMPPLGPGQPPPPAFFPPFPTEEKMKRGRLNAEASLGPVGETHSVGRPRTPSPAGLAGPSQQLAPGRNPYRLEQRPLPQFFDLDLDLNPDL